MPRIAEVSELAPLLRSRRDLLGRGWTERQVRSAVASGEFVAVRRGWVIPGAMWRDLWPEGRHLAHVIAVVRDGAGGGVVSHESAAVIWGLPLYRFSPSRVQLTVAAPTRISSGPDVMRHVAPLGTDDICIRHGIRSTTLSRTVFDAIRTLPIEAAVSIADAAERQMAARGREWDLDAVESWRRQLAARLENASGARGIRQGRRVFDFSDGRAQLPGESVSRLQLARLGFAPPRLQVPVRAADGGWYHVDFGLDEVRSFGEFDGKGKYVDEALRKGLTIEEVMLEEKQREDWIRGVTQWRMARWGDAHAASAERLGRRLASFGIEPPT